MNYRKGYTLLFNRITDALEQLAQQNAPAAAKILKLAQQEAEELYLAGEPEHDLCTVPQDCNGVGDQHGLSGGTDR